jgi:formamidopyrimidine-DNA glycosylase
MPELPEVETLKLQLAKILPGKVIDQVEVLSAKSWQGDPKQVRGLVVTDVRRRGKALIINLKHETRNLKLSLVIHLKMTGQLIYEPHPLSSAAALPTGKPSTSPKEETLSQHLKHRVVGGHPTSDFVSQLPSKHTRVIIRFKTSSPRLAQALLAERSRSPKSSRISKDPSLVKGQMSSLNNVGDSKVQSSTAGTLYFNDQRKFGWIKLVPTSQLDQVKFLKQLGPEPWDLNNQQWQEILHASKKAIKLRLMDQNRVSGVGNIYANDALWEAKIDPRRPASSLSSTEATRLRQAVIKVLRQGIRYGGATAQDGKYVDLQGLGGHYQDHFKVYQREGEACPRHDGGTVHRVKLGGRGSFYCPVCQK